MSCSHLRISLLTLALALVVLGPAPAQENLELGKMWTFENPPLEYLEATYGFSATQPWLDRTRLASLRFGGGCSASFVSPAGLILTNHHCARNQIAEISPPSEDWVKDGYIAGSMAEEVKVPGLTVQQLVSMKDITGAMNAGIAPEDDDATVNGKRETNKGRILKAAREEHEGLRPEVVKLYHGGMFQLYVYKVWDDVRLVAAPNLQTAHFGGDPDNFTYPRYCIDFALCRAYEGGKPADTSAYYFKWNGEGAKEGELVFVTGSPGSTGRMLTYDTLEYRRDAYYPVVVDYVKNRIRITKEQMAKHPEKEKELRTGLLGDQNTRKAFEGYYGGLQETELMARKKKAEAQFRAKVAADPELQAKYGDAWDRMAKIAEERTELLPRLWYHSARDSGTLAVASMVLAAVDEEAPERVRAQARRRALSRPTGDPELEKEHLAAKFEAALHWLGMSDPMVRTALANRDAEEAARRIVEDSIMGDKKALKELLDGEAAAIEASTDPALEIARVIAAHGPAARERWGELEAEENVQIARIGQALFAVYGTSVSPDATFTLRLSDGIVKGFAYNGTLAPAWTSFYGLYGRATEFGNVYPFEIPQIWWDRISKVDLAKPLDFVSTNDIIGGNSGSPVINARHEVVGLVFDGNIEMLPNRYLYRDEVARTVSVHTAAIQEALLKIYDADWVVEELLGEKKKTGRRKTALLGTQRTEMDLFALKQAVQVFQLRESRLPHEGEWPSFLTEGSKRHSDPYIDASQHEGGVVRDPWGNPYQYKRINARSFEIFSWGADGQPGGKGKDADISTRKKM